jgi:hypothetical protein
MPHTPTHEWIKRITNTAGEDGTKSAVERGNEILTNAYVKENAQGRLGEIIDPKFLRFPLQIKDSAMWVKYEIKEVLAGDTGGVTLRPKPSPNVKTTIALSLPSEGLSISSNQNWSTDDAGGARGAAMQAGKNMLANGAVGTPTIEGIVNAGTEFANKGLQTSGSTQAVVDKMALNYKGPTIRTFETAHIMVPKNAAETDMIKSIVKAFRMAASPLIKGSTFGITYGLPDFFKVTYMAGSEAATGFPQYKDCYCSAVDARYSRSTFQDDNPTSIELTMTFTELDPIGRGGLGSINTGIMEGF